ncbi:MAG: peptidylprolyl isomerase [Chitinophagaceae bacterium]|nr:peptidylprolyl isomerase [Chitinophagaceae bacterium]
MIFLVKQRYLLLVKKIGYIQWVGLIAAVLFIGCNPKIADGVRKKDITKDVEMITEKGNIYIRLSDSTPLHRNNFLKLVKQHYYDGILFHRVIQHFMIQAGDPQSKNAAADIELGEGDLEYTIPAEFNSALFHKKGVIAAAREGDDVNPQKASSAVQFYIVQGMIFSEKGLDSLEKFRLNGTIIPGERRAVYTTVGGTPHLDGNYTVFGVVIKGLETVDSIAATPVNRKLGNRPLQDIHIKKARLIKRS